MLRCLQKTNTSARAKVHFIASVAPVEDAIHSIHLTAEIAASDQTSHESDSEPRNSMETRIKAGNFKAHRTRQIALNKVMKQFMKMRFFEDGYFPIENDLSRNGDLKTNHLRPKGRKSDS
jgi:hypothetical protein